MSSARSTRSTLALLRGLSLGLIVGCVADGPPEEEPPFVGFCEAPAHECQEVGERLPFGWIGYCGTGDGRVAVPIQVGATCVLREEAWEVYECLDADAPEVVTCGAIGERSVRFRRADREFEVESPGQGQCILEPDEAEVVPASTPFFSSATFGDFVHDGECLYRTILLWGPNGGDGRCQAAWDGSVVEITTDGAWYDELPGNVVTEGAAMAICPVAIPAAHLSVPARVNGGRLFELSWDGTRIP